MRARDLLHVIIYIAARQSAPVLGRIIRVALRCATHGYETNLPNDAHCERVLDAKVHADAGAWEKVVEVLDH